MITVPHQRTITVSKEKTDKANRYTANNLAALDEAARLVDHIKEVYHSPGGKEQFWGSVPLRFHAKDYTVGIRECTVKDIIEIDSFKELKALDPVYNVT